MNDHVPGCGSRASGCGSGQLRVRLPRWLRGCPSIIQDYWRWIAFMASEPGKALANDVIFDVVQFLCFGLLIGFGMHSSALAISAWGLGAAAGAVYGLWQFSVKCTFRGGMVRLRLRWGVSKWLVGTNALACGVADHVPRRRSSGPVDGWPNSSALLRDPRWSVARRERWTSRSLRVA